MSQFPPMPESLIVFAAKYLIVVPIVLIAIGFWQHPHERKDLIQSGLLVLVFSVAFAKIGGALFDDPRPFVALHRIPLIAHEPDNGFPSDHTLLGVAISVLLWRVSRPLSIVGVIVAVCVGLARVGCLIHTPLDISASVVMGFAANAVAYGMMLLVPKNRVANAIR